MKKIIKSIIFFIIFLFLWNNVFSYWLNFNWNGFYSKFSKNVDSLSSDIYSLELQNNGWVASKINSEIWKNCITRNLTENEISETVKKWNLSNIINSIDSSCKNSDWSINIATLNNQIFTAISNISDKAEKNAEEKSEKLTNLSNLWIYADWIEKNAPFDLLEDLKDIDTIIFWEEKVYKFDASETQKLDDKIKDLLWKLAKNNINNQNNWNDPQNWNNVNHRSWCYLDWNCDNFSDIQKLLCDINNNCNWEESVWFLSIKNNFDCKIDTSWLNSATASIITNTLERAWSIEKKSENNKNFTSSRNSKNILTQNQNIIQTTSPSTWYKRVNDKKIFKCDFFCIDVNFKNYNHWLLWGWTWEEPSISYLIKRSNNHLWKFINWSLAQSKMTLNNFELWLKDLNFSEMFHMWVDISYEQVPMLFLPKTEEDEKPKWELALNTQLEKWYSAFWLDYKMQNDLSAFKQIENKIQAWLNSNSSLNTSILRQLDDTDKERIKSIQEYQEVTKTLEEKLKFDTTWDLESQLKEVERFNKSLWDYTTKISNILKKIKQKPSDKSKS